MMDGSCSTYGGRGEVYTGFWLGNKEGKGQSGIPRYRWEDSIKMDLQEVGWRGIDWINLDQDRDRWLALVNAELNLWVP
jgi:hypothetical protein